MSVRPGGAGISTSANALAKRGAGSHGRCGALNWHSKANGRSAGRRPRKPSACSPMTSSVCPAASLAPLDHDRRVEIHPLPGQHRRIIIADWRAIDVPLADHSGVIARCAQKIGPGRSIVEARLVHEARLFAVCHQPVRMGVEPREIGRAARQAQRIGHERLGEAHPAVADPVQIGGLQDGIAVGTERRLRMIVGHDEQDVRALAERLPRRHARRQRQRGGSAAETLEQ